MDVIERRQTVTAEAIAQLRADLQAEAAARRRPPGPWGFTALVNWLIYRRWPGER